MAERSCPDCQWENKYKDVVTFWGCNKPAPQGLPDAFQLVPRTSPFVNCEGWEKRALTREEQIEAAARAFVDGRSRIEPRHFDDVIRALALPKANEPAQPTEAEMRVKVIEAGWTHIGNGGWLAPSGAAGLLEAYTRVMREKGEHA